jgi:hypothetical protein
MCFVTGASCYQTAAENAVAPTTDQLARTCASSHKGSCRLDCLEKDKLLAKSEDYKVLVMNNEGLKIWKRERKKFLVVTERRGSSMHFIFGALQENFIEISI